MARNHGWHRPTWRRYSWVDIIHENGDFKGDTGKKGSQCSYCNPGMMKSLIYIGELKRFKPRTEVVYTVNEGRSKRTCIYNQNSREMTRAWTIEFKAYSLDLEFKVRERCTSKPRQPGLYWKTIDSITSNVVRVHVGLVYRPMVAKQINKIDLINYI